MLTLQQRQSVGEDILMVRHGARITSMRADKVNDRVIAVLSDGTTDSAPNLIAPGLAMPESTWKLLKGESKFLFWATVATMVAAALTFLGVWILGDTLSPHQLSNLAAAYTYPGGN